jgi:hypothetical protein
MKKKLAVVLIGAGLCAGLMGGVASAAAPFDGKCVGNGVAAAAKANASSGFPVKDFVLDLQTGDCANP